MKNLEKLDKEIVRKIADEMSDFAKTVAEKYGLKYQRKGGSFTEDSFSPSIKFEIIAGENSTGDTVSSVELQVLRIYGLKLGQIVKMNNKSFEIIGAKPRATKNDIKIKDVVSKKIYVASGVELSK